MDQSPTTKWYLKLIFMTLPFLVMGGCLEVTLRAWGQVRNVGPSFSEYDATYGKHLKRNLDCKRYAPEFEMSLTTNSRGHRGPEWSETSTGGVVLIGDSFTMGYGVSDGEEYAAVLRKALDKRHGPQTVPVVNMGMGNNGNGRWLKLLKKQVPGYQPRLVVFQFCQNDFDDNQRERLFGLSDEGALIERPVPAKSGMRAVQQAIEAVPGLPYSHLLNFSKQMQAELKGRMAAQSAAPPSLAATVTSTAPNYSERLTLALLTRAIEMCRERHWPVLMLAAELQGPRGKMLRDLAQALNVELIAVPDKSQRPDLYFVIDGHWDVDGQRYVGEVLAKRVLAGSEIPSP